MLQGAVDRIGPIRYRHPTDVSGVIFTHNHFGVSRIEIIFFVFINFQRIQQARAQLAAKLRVIRFVFTKIGGHIANDQSFHVFLILQGIFHCQQAAPGIAKQVEIIRRQAQFLAHGFHFFHEAFDRPEAGIGRLVRIIRAKLVVFVKFNIRLRKEALEALQVLVRHRRATVQQQHFHVGVIAKALRPDFVAPVYFNHLDTGSLERAGRAEVEIIAGFIRRVAVGLRRFAGKQAKRQK